MFCLICSEDFKPHDQYKCKVFSTGKLQYQEKIKNKQQQKIPKSLQISIVADAGQTVAVRAND